jgi:Cu+-exporting ATPase|tara:strand:- start:321 stop:1196 length:876 start_codon:yes stop_codon:yes gene_type:complete
MKQPGIDTLNQKKIEDTNAIEQLRVHSASCASCVSKIEDALHRVGGVKEVVMNLAQRTVYITGQASVEVMINAIKSTGYHAERITESYDQNILDEKEKADEIYYKHLMRNMWIALSLGIPLMIYSLVIGEMTITTTTERIVWLVVGLLTFGVMFVSGKNFYVNAWKSLANHSANMDMLIALGTGTAWLYSMIVVFYPSVVPEMERHVYFGATAMIIGLINLGLALKVKARSRTSEAIKRRIALQPKTARIVCNGEEMDIAIKQVQLGDHVQVRPGKKVLVDGLVVEEQCHA